MFNFKFEKKYEITKNGPVFEQRHLANEIHLQLHKSIRLCYLCHIIILCIQFKRKRKKETEYINTYYICAENCFFFV